MTLQEAVDILRAHNAWRRDDGMCIDMGDPTEIGIALDTLCNAADALIESDRIHGEQIAREISPPSHVGVLFAGLARRAMAGD